MDFLGQLLPMQKRMLRKGPGREAGGGRQASETHLSAPGSGALGSLPGAQHIVKSGAGRACRASEQGLVSEHLGRPQALSHLCNFCQAAPTLQLAWPGLQRQVGPPHRDWATGHEALPQRKCHQE